MSPEKTYTLQEFIKSKPVDNINLDTFSIFDKVNGTYMAIYNVLDNYYYELKKLSKLALMNEDEYEKYCMAPRILAYDLYGRTELFFILLFINDIFDVKDFNKKKIRIIEPDLLSDVLSEIYKSEYNTLIRFNSKIDSTSN